MKSTELMSIVALAVTLATGAAFAENVNVSRCNYTEGAAFKPALWITKDGITRLVKVDQEGLTRRIIYNDVLAKEFVRAQMGADTPASNVSITNSCSKTTFSNAEEKDIAPVVAVVVPDVVIDPVLVIDTTETFTSN